MDIPPTQGIVPLELGNARTITDYKHLIHIINLQAHADNIQKTKETIDQFETTRFAETALKTTKLRLDELIAELNLLTPKIRKKRGLVNALGSAIKFITGNMDYKDAENLNRNIEYLQTKNGQIENTLNQQLILNTNMIQRFENITNHINKEQHIITQSIKNMQDQTRNSLNPTINTIIQMQQLNQINYNIDILTQHLNNIAEALILSKMNIIPKIILDPKELTEMHNTLNNTIDILSPEHIYELLELTAYYNNTNIIFNIQIPIISNTTYKFFHIITTPINKTLKIISEDYALINNNSVTSYKEKCKKIENQFYCGHMYGTEYNMNNNCIKDIIFRNKTASCHLQDVGHIVDILHPEPNYLILINSPTQQITTLCNNVTEYHNISSTTVIYFINCTVAVNNVWYTGEKDIYWDIGNLIEIPPTFNNNIIILSKKEEITLPKLNEYRFQDKEFIYNLRTNTEEHKKITYSAFGSIALLLIILSMALILRKPNTITYSLDQRINEVQAANCPKPLWPSLHFKEGGVICNDI